MLNRPELSFYDYYQKYGQLSLIGSNFVFEPTKRPILIKKNH
jgi:hypothetical protein